MDSHITDFSLDAATTAILAIDIQNGFCDPEGSMSKAGGNIEMMRSTISPIRELVQVGRSQGIPDIWTKQEHYADDVTKKKHKILPHTLRWAAGPTGVKGTWDSEFCAEVADLVGSSEEIVVKHRFSSFFDTRLDTMLRMRGITTLVVTGVATTHCVETTVRDAYQKDYDVIVPAEAVGALDPKAHDASLWMIDRFFGKVLPLATVIELLKGGSVEIDFRDGWLEHQS